MCRGPGQASWYHTVSVCLVLAWRIRISLCFDSHVFVFLFTTDVDNASCKVTQLGHTNQWVGGMFRQHFTFLTWIRVHESLASALRGPSARSSLVRRHTRPRRSGFDEPRQNERPRLLRGTPRPIGRGRRAVSTKPLDLAAVIVVFVLWFVLVASICG